ncbi:SURF1 family protein [Methyloligella halotolerans]|uniref:SURF1-like protein n=1 Tax=Methyloligella halotolerans TaxID=1177755 RepID=A0A1E2RYP7_9HYPH|nr:SURF1 family protein [Methyloligella halotolerans]ODA67235.1 SURF1 family protein [Methyloligella halotolerans]
MPDETPNLPESGPESRKRFVWFTLFMLPIFALTVWLGVWQLQRLEWKRGLIAAIETRSEGPPVPLEKVMAEARAGQDVEYTRVSVHGRFDHAHEEYLYGLDEGDPGWHVITPFRTDEGPIVLIDRGFVPIEKQAPKSRIEGQLEGEVEVTGLVRGPQTPGLFTPDNDPARKRWFWRDLDGMRSEMVPEGKETVAPFYIEAELSEIPGGFPKGGQTNLTLPNNHLQYAWTWFCMAAVLGGAI